MVLTIEGESPLFVGRLDLRHFQMCNNCIRVSILTREYLFLAFE